MEKRKETMRKREIYFVEHVFGRQDHLRSLYNIALRGGGKTSSMRKGTRYDKSIVSIKSYDQSTFGLGGLKRTLGLGGQPAKSTKPRARVKVAEPVGCNKMKWKKELPWYAYLNYFQEPVHTWTESGCTVSGKKQFLHYSIEDGYCCKSTKPLKSQAQQWIRNLGIPGLIEMAPTGDDLKTYIALKVWWERLRLNAQYHILNLMGENREDIKKRDERDKTKDLPLYDQYRHTGKLKSKILAFEQMYRGIKHFAHHKFAMGKEFDKKLPDPHDDDNYLTALGYAFD